MTEYNWNGYIVQVDKETTRALYEEDCAWNCPCPECQNFVAAVEHLPQELLDILKELGISPEKPVDACDYNAEQKRVYYSICYSIVGRLVSSPQRDDNAESYGIHCYEALSPFTVGFPTPYFDLVYSGWLPWVLDEPMSPHWLLWMKNKE